MSDPQSSQPRSDGPDPRWRNSASRPDGNWPGVPIVGLAVVVVGVIFLARNFGLYLPLPDRWWAIFVLIPAAASLVSAARFFRIDNGFSSRVAGAATAGILMLVVALILFLDLEWDKVWPVLVIIVGAGIMMRGYRRRR